MNNLPLRCNRLQRFGTISVAAAGIMIAASLAAGSAHAAATFDYSSYSVTNEINVTISAGPTQGTYGAGQIVLNGASGTANSGQTLATWCIDAFTDLQGSGLYNIVSPPNINNAGGASSVNGLPSANIQTLSSQVLGEIGALINYGNAQIVAGNGAIMSPATQLAIWTVEYSSLGYSFAPASGWDPNGTIASEVTTLVGDVSGSHPLLAPVASSLLREVVSVQNGVAQNQGLAFTVSAVPLPAALPMMAAGLIGLGLYGRKRKQKTAA
jgi:hypothetical protein